MATTNFGGIIKMSESIEQTIFHLIKTKDEKAIQKLLEKNLTTKEMVEEQRESFKKIYGGGQDDFSC